MFLFHFVHFIWVNFSYSLLTEKQSRGKPYKGKGVYNTCFTLAYFQELFNVLLRSTWTQFFFFRVFAFYI